VVKAVELTCWNTTFNAQHSEKGKEEDKVKNMCHGKKAKGNNPNHPSGTKQLFGEEIFGEKQNVRSGRGEKEANIRANLGAAVVIVKEEGSPTPKKWLLAQCVSLNGNKRAALLLAELTLGERMKNGQMGGYVINGEGDRLNALTGKCHPGQERVKRLIPSIQ
jgi:hypothetical protein